MYIIVDLRGNDGVNTLFTVVDSCIVSGNTYTAHTNVGTHIWMTALNENITIIDSAFQFIVYSGTFKFKWFRTIRTIKTT